jgi:glyoxylase-like metal-dependent hydrolase (beta-lactamase superfamily II)
MTIRKAIVELPNNLYTLQEGMFVLYLIRGQKSILIDTAIHANRKSILSKIRSILGSNPLDYIFLTHSHYDHTGSLSYIQKHTGAHIYGSERTIELLKKPDVRLFITEMNNRFNRLLGTEEMTGFPELEHMHGLKNGDTISLGNGNLLKVISTPGHTKCSISFLLNPGDIIFPGDSTGVIERNGKIKPLFLSDYNMYLSSLKKIEGISPKILALPHNTPIMGKEKVHDFLNMSIQASELLGNKIMTALKKGNEPERISVEIMEKEYPMPTVEGPRKAFNINLMAMIKAVDKFRRGIN